MGVAVDFLGVRPSFLKIGTGDGALGLASIGAFSIGASSIVTEESTLLLDTAVRRF